MKSSKFSSIVLWSVISAAFIGPGTITTAVSAGSTFQLDLLWVVLYATLTCILVQEAAARITITSGLNLGQTFRIKFGDRIGRWFQFIIGGIVIGGCAAFEAGNIAGAVSGLKMITDINSTPLIVIISAMAAFLLWLGRPYWISGVMMIFVGLMGIAFVLLAFSTQYSLPNIVGSAITPTLPDDSLLLVLGLFGTTIVPYNIFLGSGISHGQSIPLMRIGLTVSVILGGAITAFILIAGTVVPGFASFDELMTSVQSRIGTTGVFALAFGLFAAGFSSAVTAPYASSVIASVLFGWSRWKVASVWLFVIITGAIFSMADVETVQLIIAAQALNGVILPVLILLLILVMNDKRIIPEKNRPGIIYNSMMIITFLMVSVFSCYKIYLSLMKL
jgi:Mn2+/Fe2+ NRAMP family transporter